MNGTNTTSGRVRKRAAEACVFCRKRKIKCNNARPVCVNCQTYSKACVYEPVDGPSKAPQPTANKASRSPGRPLPNNGDGRSPQGPRRAVNERQSQGPVGTPQSLSRIVVSANGVSYHGQTSALFEENLHDRPFADARPVMSEEWIEKGLVAEATRQRQSEDLNSRSGNLDFDGVDPELGLHLLSLHWNRQHHSFLITYRPAFMRDMACNGPYFSKLLLNAIYFGASKFSPRPEVRRDPNDVRTAGWKFRERVRELLGGALDRSDITTIQALLVMTNSLFALGDERSAAWLYAGLAFRMIFDLGMHVDAPDLASARKFSDEDLEIRRRVFWGAFVVDKIQSLYQGRPVSIKECDALVPMKFLDTYEELEHWKPFAYSAQSGSYPGSPAYSISTFKSLCKLSVVMSDILSCIYTERSFDRNPTELSQMLESLHSRLVAWHDSLPSHLLFDPDQSNMSIPPPHVLSLHAMHHVLLILLHRPFVADGHLYNTSRSITVNSFMTCATAASNIVRVLRAYDQAFSVRRAPYLISYATYVAATIHARIAAKRGRDSEAHKSLETCLAVFRDNQETNWAVRKAYMIVQNLMKRLGVVAAQQSDTANDPPQSENNAAANGRDDPFSVDLDIDGIILSFVREQEVAHSAPGWTTGQTCQGDSADASGPTPYTEDISRYDGQPYTRQRGEIPVSVQDPGVSWIPSSSGPPAAAASVDDLLFGFNGSDLDGFPFLAWDAN